MKQGQHYKQGETKENIIRYVLAHSAGGAEEPALRKYLNDNNDIVNIETIKKHLKELEKEGYIKKCPTDGKSNHWIVNDIEQVCKIFKDYEKLRPDLRRNDAVAEMLLNKHHIMVKEPETHKFFRMIVEISPSFFEMCLKHSSETLLEISDKLIESKLIQFFDTNNLFYASDINPYLGNFETKDKQLLMLFHASIISDILNNYNPDFNYDNVRNPNWIKLKDIDEVNFISQLPTVEMSVKLLDESKL